MLIEQKFAMAMIKAPIHVKEKKITLDMLDHAKDFFENENSIEFLKDRYNSGNFLMESLIQLEELIQRHPDFKDNYNNFIKFCATVFSIPITR